MQNPAASSEARFERVVLPNRRWVVGILLLCVVALIGGIFALVTPVPPGQDPKGAFAQRFTGYVGTPCFVLLIGLSIRLLLNRTPVLIVNEQGITTRYSGLIPWSEVAGVLPGRVENGPKALLIFVRDVERLAARQSPAQAKYTRRNAGYEGYVAAVPEALLPMKTEALLLDIGTYCYQRIQEYGPVG